MTHSWHGSAFNRTRQVFLATELGIADSFFTRLRGLLGTPQREFAAGRGLWIDPCQGVHGLGMRYAIDAVYLDHNRKVIHIHTGLRPWRMGALRWRAAGVLELPAGAVARSQTQLGDQILICAEPVPGSRSHAG